ncbi:GH36-type glycosyl hydrolase domain-containing protein [Pseudoalteromonas sp. NZS37]|uniref:GH36-type glycosyl hydrolase domain-containing protein n=1 Tax=Pseudoalteromonas sp. NZS37 TaxID=2792071 RepID=UPI0018CF53E8|nr:glucoamylase family protein [Pseudoalteromonas sp. NZS37]MBG9990336.1 cyclic beta 1-2 glucan synthetase [Pseudoalteromonas sp. NZS37]
MNKNKLINILSPFFPWLKSAPQKEQIPIRSELLSAEQMEKHAKSLAKSHILDAKNTQDQLLERLDENEKVLIKANSLLTIAVKAKQPIVPSGEWLLDNFYLIEEQIRTARLHLPKHYSQELPRLEQGASLGMPRVYDIALNVISHGDGRVDSEILAQFLAAYQTVTTLNLGELWAIPIMLRLALIENLQRVSTRIIIARQHLNLAQQWANQMLEIAEQDPNSLILVIADMARSKPPMESAFVAELTRLLQGHGSALALPLTWIEQQLADSSLTIEQLVQKENQQQAADQVSISNNISSLRWLTAMNWADFVEDHSAVEHILRQDIEGVYGYMDFITRDSYRKIIDQLAKRSSFSEVDIAKKAIKLAQQADQAQTISNTTLAPNHVGYYLIDKGITQLKQRITVKTPIFKTLFSQAKRITLVLYLGAIISLTALISASFMAMVVPNNIPHWQFILLIILTLFGASQLASALVNWIVTLLVDPQRLPRMDYSKGLPAQNKTFVVIPTMLTSSIGIEQLLEVLEVRFLGNRDQHIHFALLTDFTDAEQQTLPTDEALLSQVRLGIENLNAKYAEPSLLQQESRFFLLHRPRTWNPKEQIWMGFERKRGKLSDLNSLLRNPIEHAFELIVGDINAIQKVKYVITLDTDTQLPRDCARQLVATMAHPLNQPRFDEKRQCIVGGYGILQPRMAASLSGHNPSRYSQLFGEEPGIDPYTRSISDVYQDLFSQGSFIGKGIYDIDAFEQTLGNRLPQNQILSHDLLEGCYARSGLISDVHLYEEYPTRYNTDMCRRERWIRGDWQIVRWLLPRVLNTRSDKCQNPLSPLSRWKILDNLRRSVEPLAIFLLLTVGWFTAANPLKWTLAISAIYLLPPLLSALISSMRKPAEMLISHHLHDVLQCFVRQLIQIGFRLACLPFEAVFNLTAILRSAGRMLFTQRRLLEWHVTDHKSNHVVNALINSYYTMWTAPFIAITLIASLLYFAPLHLTFTNILAVFPLLLLWLLSPAITWWFSEPKLDNLAPLSDKQQLFLQTIARKTWAFFDHFNTADDHWLIPDNYQEEAGPVIAHRTSPTNIGLSLLANVSAYDFGFIVQSDLIQRTQDCFNTLDKLERHEGHFYNWYDTQTLQPLPPRYISSVDSGNLAGHLLTLQIALKELPSKPIVHPQMFEGISITLAIVANLFKTLQLDSEQNKNNIIDTAINAMSSILNAVRITAPTNLYDVEQHLITLNNNARILLENIKQDATNDLDTKSQEHKVWTQDLHRQCQRTLNELYLFSPWLKLTNPPVSLKLLFLDSNILTMQQLVKRCPDTINAIDALLSSVLPSDETQWLSSLRIHTLASTQLAKDCISQCDKLANRAIEFAQMEYAFLYDESRHLLAIGYNVDEHRRDTSFYDLLASEARLASFIAIAQGKLPQQTWFALSRLLTSAGAEPVLVSWSGSMFEYLMPMLVMPSYDGTLLEQTCRAAVTRQIDYGKRQNVPWGISESAYNTVDASLNFQYHAFGVPGLGLKRGLSEDLVIAPYASALALMVNPQAACENLQLLADSGLEGHYGLYEAIDYTPARLSRDQKSAVIRSFMAHHQGMSLLALAYHLLDQPMQKRFESDPLLQSALLLLQERVPKTSIFQPHIDQYAESGALFEHAKIKVNPPIPAITPTPQVQLLSNGRYHVMLTNAGGGYSRWTDLAVTRWREDPTCDNWGTFVYIRDTATGDFWSAAHQPTLKPAQSYSASFSEGRAEFRRSDQHIETYTEIVVSPEDDIELRRIRLSNHSPDTRTIDITTYAEVVMANPAADLMQPSFSNLFVQTEILPCGNAILCTRRARSADEKTPWMFHLLSTRVNSSTTKVGPLSCTTDRMQFIGRGRSLVSPQAMLEMGELDAKQGSVLDPIVAIRAPVTLLAGSVVTLDVITGMAQSRQACLALIAKYQDHHITDRALDLAWTHSDVTLRQINANEADAQLYRQLAGYILYANATLRANASVLIQNRRGQSGLWGYSISGDLPIILLKVASGNNIEIARQLIQCHAYWRLKGLVADLVIWNEEQVGYRQGLQDQIMGLIATGTESHYIDRPGGIFVRSAEQISNEDRILLQAVSRIIIDQSGTLAEQVNRRTLAEKNVKGLIPTQALHPKINQALGNTQENLLLNNGLGGFSEDGREYIITTTEANPTPLPWVNVLANAHFGSVIDENGFAYTWSENAHEFRLTPWSADTTGSSGGEAFYLRDEDTGKFWSPCAMPKRGANPYITRHGFGYSTFEHSETGIESSLCVYVDTLDAVKYSVLKIKNNSLTTRRLSATGYVEWVLGDLRSKTALHLVTEIDAKSGALVASNAYNSEFGGRVAFFDVDDMSRTLTGDRSEFIGRNKTLHDPQAMTRTHLSGNLGAALDPCGAIQVPFELQSEQERTIIFRLGAAQNKEQASTLALKLRKPGTARIALEKVTDFWQQTLGSVQVNTPDPALNVLANGWLVYQTLACRFWARSGFYQSGGAFGFRDQLQDAMALIHASPALLRDHILYCATRQYSEGDVQHWWHPPSGRGVRTRCSDDYLWLPLATCRYIKGTDDITILDELMPFIEGRPLKDDEESYYDLPSVSAARSSLYKHCVLAIEHGLHFGEKGLPLMGSGDWNDGMSLVGIHGKGESVWLGFFLYKILQEFSPIAALHGDIEFATRCDDEAQKLQGNLAKHAWDGAWYRRAWFDDGTALGSSQSPECTIDSIAQSWSVLSGAANNERSTQAMSSLYQHLVNSDDKLIQLLNPPFDKSKMNPGYIKGYVPGVRENGGQYTHAAIWASMAFAQQGDKKRAWELMNIINPLNHAKNAEQVETYKGEPYVVAADVYAVAPHIGRGGWTWYTGSAGWLYRLIIESLLGVTRTGNKLTISPCIPEDWSTYSIDYRFESTYYHITIEQIIGDEKHNKSELILDGMALESTYIPLENDKQKHEVHLSVYSVNSNKLKPSKI